MRRARTAASRPLPHLKDQQGDVVRLLDHVRPALDALRRHGIRTLLTMLGIIFGTGAVISMLSIGAGAQAEALQTIDAMGLRNVIVRDRPPEEKDLFGVREKSLGLSRRDHEAMRAVAADVSRSSTRKRVRVDRVLSASGRSTGQVLGVGADDFALMNRRVAEGSLFDAAEEAASRRSCVLGAHARQDLFAFSEAVGQPVKVGDTWFVVTGVLEGQSATSDSFEGV